MFKKSFFISVLLICATITSVAQNIYVGVWTGKLSVGQASLTLVLNISEDENGKLSCTLDSPDQGAKGIKADISTNDGMLEVSVPSIRMKYKGTPLNDLLSGTFFENGMEFPLTFEKGEEKLNRPQTPLTPFPYTQEEVTFSNENAGAILSGTLIVPSNASPKTPVVLFISGSGLEDRNEEIFDHKPFLVIADYLARNGIASLRYDDRSFGASKGGDVKNATTLDFMEDAKAGLAFLRGMGHFERIGILGHSEGASIAFMLGAAKECDFVISMAGIGVKGDEVLTAQANKVLELRGVEARYTVQEYRTNVAMQGNAWLNWFINYNPTNDISNCKCPVFALNGAKDVQVISSLNLAAIGKLLCNNPANSVKEYPDLNHLFQHCTTGDPNEYRSIEETVSPEVLADIVAWIKL